jgi:hypothetical protein
MINHESDRSVAVFVNGHVARNEGPYSSSIYVSSKYVCCVPEKEREKDS